ncbi:hypothetical protein HPB50_000733 [Hyalomma asiaticum]|uniref:Uncharacterized protein n=1 Tax=Hyalomma asiaticum TaxID=266040 RepID=A0ACB7SR78_HYAAI|nr:hypothetical protein HPB50_000733 [Hyalomma asiaticum]
MQPRKSDPFAPRGERFQAAESSGLQSAIQSRSCNDAGCSRRRRRAALLFFDLRSSTRASGSALVRADRTTESAAAAAAAAKRSAERRPSLQHLGARGMIHGADAGRARYTYIYRVTGHWQAS